jgi:hypothetical protein
MNPVEDQVRDALHAHAEDFTAHPDAWQQLCAKSRADKRSWLTRIGVRTHGYRRPRRALTWSRFVIPAAAAAAVIAIILGATVLTSPGSPRDGSGAVPASPSASGAPAPPSRSNYLIQQDPPVSSIVEVKVTVEDGVAIWVSVWFGRMQENPGRTVLCSQVVITGTPYDGFCEPVQIPAGHVAVSADSYDSIELGEASPQVASVSAQVADGPGAGKLVWGRGFPAKVWLVNTLAPESNRVVFRSAAGLEIGKLNITGTGLLLTSHPRSGGITVARYPAGFQGPKAGTITAYLADSQFELWVSGNSPGVSFPGPPSGPPDLMVSIVRAGAFSRSKLVEFSGYAPQNVARVTLRLADGRQFSARTIAGWKGSGLRLWSFPVTGGLSNTVKYVALGYNAANQVVSQLTMSSPG